MAQRIPTRLGDGSLVELTRGGGRGRPARRRRGGRQARQGRAAHRRRARPPARHLHLPGEVQRRRLRRRGRAQLRRLGQRRPRRADPRADRLPEPPRRRHDRAVAPRLLLQGRAHRALVPDADAQGRAAADGGPAQLRRHARPGPVLAAGRPRARTGRSCMPLGKIAEARAAQMEAVEHLEHDMWCVAEAMVAAGVDGLDFDTAGAAGDADLLATLRTCPQGARHVAGHRRRDRPGRRARARHARRARVRGHAGWPASGRSASSAPAPPPAPPSSGRPST